MTTSFTSAFRGAFRALRRRPGFFAIAVSSLGIALGLSTAVFALIDALQHPLATNDGADQVFHISTTGSGERGRGVESSREVQDLVQSLPGFDEVTGYVRWNVWVETGPRGAMRWRHEVLPNYTRVLGLRPAKGRLFNGDDFTQRGVAVVSDAVWRSHFNNRPEIGTATITVDDKKYAVVGILPPHAQAADILIPTAQGAVETSRRGRYELAGRLKPGWDPERMRAGLAAVEARLTSRYGVGSKPFRVGLRSIRPEPIKLKDYHFAMISAAIGILLIACANVAALMLARGVSNRRDYALHLALGARPLDLTRGVIAEVTVIAVFGAVAGTIIAAWATNILTVSVPENLNNLGLPTPQWSLRVFGLAFAAMLAAIAIAAAGPAWFAARTNPQEPLKDSAGTTTGRASTRFRLLVVTEMALSMVLLVGASLMAKSVRVLANPELGYDPRTLFRAFVSFPHGTSAAPSQPYAAQQTLDRVRAIPGVMRAALYSERHPDSSSVVTDLTASGGPTLRYNPNDTYVRAGTDFFATFGIPLLSGRDFVDGDRMRGAIVLSRRAERALFPRGSALGRLIKFADARSTQPWYPVVGVVDDMELRPRDEMSTDEPAPAIYAFLPDSADASVSIIARTRGAPEPIAADASYLLRDLAPAGSRVTVTTWLSMFEQQIRAAKYVGRLFVMLGVASLVLAAAGLFSVLSYVVSQRMREFAVRMALGARQHDVVRLVVRDAMVMALAGTAIGAGVGMWAGFFIWDILYGVYPVDAEALIIAETTLLLATLVACAIPAVRATRASPLDVIRAT